MSTGAVLLLLAVAFVIAVVIVALACRQGDPPSPLARGAAIFTLATIYNGFWFGIVQLFHALFGPF